MGSVPSKKKHGALYRLEKIQESMLDNMTPTKPTDDQILDLFHFYRGKTKHSDFLSDAQATQFFEDIKSYRYKEVEGRPPHALTLSEFQTIIKKYILDVEEVHHHVFLIGSNGCGKSTLLDRFLFPTGGAPCPWKEWDRYRFVGTNQETIQRDLMVKQGRYLYRCKTNFSEFSSYVRNANVRWTRHPTICFVCWDVNEPKSLEEAFRWAKEVERYTREECGKYILGLKDDLSKAAKVMQVLKFKRGLHYGILQELTILSASCQPRPYGICSLPREVLLIIARFLRRHKALVPFQMGNDPLLNLINLQQDWDVETMFLSKSSTIEEINQVFRKPLEDYITDHEM